MPEKNDLLWFSSSFLDGWIRCIYEVKTTCLLATCPYSSPLFCHQKTRFVRVRWSALRTTCQIPPKFVHHLKKKNSLKNTAERLRERRKLQDLGLNFRGALLLLLSAEDYVWWGFNLNRKRLYSTRETEAGPIHSDVLNAKQRIRPHKGCAEIRRGLKKKKEFH